MKFSCEKTRNDSSRNIYIMDIRNESDWFVATRHIFYPRDRQMFLTTGELRTSVEIIDRDKLIGTSNNTVKLLLSKCFFFPFLMDFHFFS